jgi:hypothetical protein
MRVEQAMIWLLRTMLFSGYGATVTSLKEMASAARASVFKPVDTTKSGRWVHPSGGKLVLRRFCPIQYCSTHRQCLQWSYLGRALPIGDSAVVEKALIAHRENLMKKPYVPPDRLERARKFARYWAEGHCPYLTVGEIALTSGGCLEKSRREGGLAAFLHEVYSESDESPLPQDPPTGVCKADWDSFLGDVRLREALLDQVDRCAHEHPPAKVSVVRERGYKARIVTRSPGALVALGHFLRAVVLAALRRDGHCREVFDDHKGAVESMFVSGAVPLPCWILSADLSNATDTIPIELALALFEGLCEGFRFGARLLVTGRLILGPQWVEWADGTSSLSSCGILMGLPLSWVMLCICQLFWVSEAKAKVRSIPTAPRLGPTPFRICGDDLISIWPAVLVVSYNDDVVE